MCPGTRPHTHGRTPTHGHLTRHELTRAGSQTAGRPKTIHSLSNYSIPPTFHNDPRYAYILNPNFIHVRSYNCRESALSHAVHARPKS